ncbi:MAG: EAL domain-containing protein [Actinomycetes bacterium]
MLEGPHLHAALAAGLSTSNAPAAVVSAGTFLWANASCERLLGRSPGTLPGHPVDSVLPTSDSCPRQSSQGTAAFARSPYPDGVYRLARPDGAVRWVCLVGTPLGGSGDGTAAKHPAAPEPPPVLLLFTDITAEREAQQRLRQQATHDPFTGLPNRLLFHEHLAHALKRLQRGENRSLSVLFIDVDRFRHINHNFGHTVGEQLLVSVAERIAGAVRSDDVVARVGGDEFAVLLEDLTSPDDAHEVAERCLNAVARPHEIHGERLVVTASIGIATASTMQAADDTDVLTAASNAMYRAKDNGRGQIEHLTSPLVPDAAAASLERQLVGALDRGELEVHYQPIIDLDTGRVTAGEALLRWRHPDLGLLTAGRFISIAESAGLMGPIGDWVTDVVCADLRRWDDAGNSIEHVYINVAAQQIRHDFVQRVSSALDAHDVAPGRLRLEITETELMSSARSLEHLEALHRLGCSLVVDDFGTGYSSLSRLIDLPIDVVKIDQSFISGLGVDPRPTAVVSAAILLAHDLRQGVVAEGVETEDQRRWLSNAGCTFAQGFGIARPMPAGDFPPALSLPPLT